MKTNLRLSSKAEFFLSTGSSSSGCGHIFWIPASSRL